MQSQPPFGRSMLVTLFYGCIFGLALGNIEFFQTTYSPLQYVIVHGYLLGPFLNPFIWLVGWLCAGILTARYTRNERYGLLAGLLTGFLQVTCQGILGQVATYRLYGASLSLHSLLSNIKFIALRAPSQTLLIMAAGAGVGIIGGIIGKKFFQRRQPYRRSEATFRQQAFLRRIAATYGILAGLAIALLYAIITMPVVSSSLVPNQEPGTWLLWFPLVEGTILLFATTFITSMLAAKRGGNQQAGRLTALWVGILGLLITLTTLFLLRNVYIANIQSILIGNIAVLKEHFNEFYSTTLLFFIPGWIVGMACLGALGSSIGKRMAPATPKQAPSYQEDPLQELQEMQ